MVGRKNESVVSERVVCEVLNESFALMREKLGGGERANRGIERLKDERVGGGRSWCEGGRRRKVRLLRPRRKGSKLALD